jgi:hypothetical protein
MDIYLIANAVCLCVFATKKVEAYLLSLAMLQHQKKEYGIPKVTWGEFIRLL